MIVTQPKLLMFMVTEFDLCKQHVSCDKMYFLGETGRLKEPLQRARHWTKAAEEGGQLLFGSLA